MKELWKVSKWAAIILLGAGLLFAGCTGSDSSSSSSSSSSEDDPIPVGPGENSFLVQVNPLAEDMVITPMTLGAATSSVPGRLVELTSNGTCAWTGATNTLSCDLTLINLDPDEIMLTAQTHTFCDPPGSCPNPTLATADYPAPGAQLIDGVLAGICYAENGWDSNSSPTAVPEGCPVEVIGGADFAITFLGANGGSVTDTWDLTNETVPYQFITVLTGTAWQPEDPYAGDTRYDFQNYSTYVLDFYDNDNLNPTYCNLGGTGIGYPVGTPWCSSKTNVDAVPAGGTIHLNVGIDYPDRLETAQWNIWNMAGGSYDGNPSGGTPESYEYVSVAQIEVVYDPAVITHGGSGGEFDNTICTNGTRATPYSCTFQPAPSMKFGWTEISQYTNNAADNRINTLNNRNLSSFVFLGALTWLYGPEGAGLGSYCTVPAGMPAPLTLQAGNEGIFTWTGFTTGGTFQCNMSGGVDNDLDLWVSRIPFTVTGAAGDYTVVKVAQNTNSNVNIYHSNNTAAGGPPGDDITGGITGWCASDLAGDQWDDDCAGTPCCDVNPNNACGGAEHHFVSRSLERTNCNLPPSWGSSRADCAGGAGTCGGRQDTHTHILVQ